MLWPALTWRGQEWAQHVQGQLLHTCIMQAAGSSRVMELLTDSIYSMSFTVEAVLIEFLLLELYLELYCVL